MLNLWFGKENLPKNLEFVFDIEAAFTGMKLQDTYFTRKVMEEIEEGRFLDQEIFQDRFGRGLYSGLLSTGSKILLYVERYPDKIVNASELGTNAVGLLLYLPEGNVYFPEYREVNLYCPEVQEMSISVNGIVCDSYDMLEDVIWEATSV